MEVRQQVRRTLVSALGEERIQRLGRVERSWRRKAANALAPETAASGPRRRNPGMKVAAKQRPPKKAAAPRRQPPDPFAEFPTPTATRHQLLAHMHRELRPRTYLETGIADGSSMTLSRTRSIGVDPAFKVTKPLQCDVQLVDMESDAFFAQEDALAHFGGVPLDLAFIDGMHLAEFALRDFMNVERAMSPAGVIVIDDMLPRNALEAARDRRTGPWTGDVFKLLLILLEQRPDLTILPVNTAPTGVVVVAGVDPDSQVLTEHYDENLRFCQAPDPQSPPDWVLHRTVALSADDVLAAPWADLAAARDDASGESARKAVAQLPTAPKPPGTA